jgi:translation initiation factor 1
MSRLFSGTPFDRPISCPKCHQAVADCRCLNLPDKKQTVGTPGKKKSNASGNSPARLDSGLVLTPANSNPPADQVAKIRIEKRKGNRMVTLVTGMEHPANDLPGLCTELKQKLGVGGSVQGRTLELQGEHGEKVKDFLVEKGLKARVV